MAFLMHFKLPIWYETVTALLSSLSQNTATHILDHINELRWLYNLIKALIHDLWLTDWFSKSLLPFITKDVSMEGVVTEE